MEFEFVTRFDINIYASFVLLVILGTMYLKRDVQTYSRKIFKLMVFTGLAMLALEILSWVWDGVDTEQARYLNYIINFVFVLFSPFIACLMASYIDFKIFISG